MAIAIPSLALGITGGSLASQVAALFSGGEQGVWIDISDLTTLFQNGGGTVPVTTVGQTVALAKDKSGRGNNATFTNCTLQQDGAGRYYIAFNGSTSNGSTPAINFAATDKMTVCAGMRKASDAATGMLLELSANANSNAGAFSIIAPNGAASPNYLFLLNGTTATNFTATTFAAPVTNVISLGLDIAGATRATELFPRINGAIPTLAGAGAADAGTGNFGNYQLFIGARGGTTLFFNGSLYGLVVRGAASSAAQVASMEAWANSKAGAY